MDMTGLPAPLTIPQVEAALDAYLADETVIEAGIPKQDGSCPIALATRRVLPPPYHTIGVGRHLLNFYYIGYIRPDGLVQQRMKTLRLGNRLARFVYRIDRCKGPVSRTTALRIWEDVKEKVEA